jgi:HJR/Mrr/RecB family endonuclease
MENARMPTAIVTRNQVSDAEAKAATASDRLRTARHRLSTVLNCQNSLTDKLAKPTKLKRIRQFGDDTITRSGFLLVCFAMASGVVLILCHLVGLRFGFWTMPLLLVTSLTCIFGAKLFNPADATLDAEIDALNRELRSLQDKQASIVAEVEKVSVEYDFWNAKYQNVLSQFNSRINRLRSTDWEILQGVPFEQFLELIFVEWGYEVETTKVTGDQGVDLIVTNGDLRVAVKAKGYPGSTVGNSAVQEAHTGMRLYHCHQCAVITNSTFTSAARKLAEGVGCRLIDHDMIPLLIEGEINL